MTAAPRKVPNDRAAMRELVQSQVASLKGMDASTLHALPARTVRSESGEGAAIISQYHVASETGEHKIIVQAFRHPDQFSLWPASEIDGFVTSLDGAKRCLTSEEKSPYR